MNRISKQARIQRRLAQRTACIAETATNYDAPRQRAMNQPTAMAFPETPMHPNHQIQVLFSGSIVSGSID